jgi:hypothetical protein
MDSHLDRAVSEFLAPIAGLSAEQMQRGPAGGWTRQQVVEHLLLSYRSTARGLQKTLIQKHGPRGAPTFRNRVSKFVLLTCGYFPRGREAPEPVRPAASESPMSGAQLASTLRNALTEMETAIDAAEAQLGERTRILRHHVLGPLTAREWRKFHAVHARHHVKQLARIASAEKA